MCTFKVLIDSSIATGVIVHIIEVLAFPPREDCSILVNLESRNGMKLKKKKKFKTRIIQKHTLLLGKR